MDARSLQINTIQTAINDINYLTLLGVDALVIALAALKWNFASVNGRNADFHESKITKVMI
jgi:hypothetical protein